MASLVIGVTVLWAGACLKAFKSQGKLCYQRSGFSLGTSVRITPQNRAGLERLMSCCALPPDAL